MGGGGDRRQGSGCVAACGCVVLALALARGGDSPASRSSGMPGEYCTLEKLGHITLEKFLLPTCPCLVSTLLCGRRHAALRRIRPRVVQSSAGDATRPRVVVGPSSWDGPWRRSYGAGSAELRSGNQGHRRTARGPGSIQHAYFPAAKGRRRRSGRRA
jgi:hypothetical protein